MGGFAELWSSVPWFNHKLTFRFIFFRRPHERGKKSKSSISVSPTYSTKNWIIWEKEGGEDSTHWIRNAWVRVCVCVWERMCVWMGERLCLGVRVCALRGSVMIITWGSRVKWPLNYFACDENDIWAKNHQKRNGAVKQNLKIHLLSLIMSFFLPYLNWLSLFYPRKHRKITFSITDRDVPRGTWLKMQYW